ncbi:hypothetical protein RintRC_5643 [Richelia intracellularis]|nr:hypothetical protein RintRC_5643 [Richelia intracellularis]
MGKYVGTDTAPLQILFTARRENLLQALLFSINYAPQDVNKICRGATFLGRRGVELRQVLEEVEG